MSKNTDTTRSGKDYSGGPASTVRIVFAISTVLVIVAVVGTV